MRRGNIDHEMTWDDLERFPIWVDCLEREGEVGEDFLAPIVPSRRHPLSPPILAWRLCARN
jgi:hypothetical protein